MTLFLNWLVQGSLLTLLVAGGVGLCRSLNASTREGIWWLTVGGVVALPVVGAFAAGDFGFLPPAPLGVPSSSFIQVPEDTAWWLPSLFAGWVGWLVVGLFRIGLALRGLHRAKRQATSFPPERERCLPIWSRLAGRGRPTRLVVSKDVHNAAVLGMGQPLIALAPATLQRLTDAELDDVVLHEYAHVQRRDDVALFAQQLIWAVAGMHPAIWWLDRALTVEREVACDDWVLARTRSARPYAACLLKLSVAPVRDGCSLAPRVGLSQALVAIRVTRLLNPRRNATTSRSIRTILSSVLAIASVAAASLTTTFFAFGPGAPLPRVAPAANAPALVSRSASTQSVPVGGTKLVPVDRPPTPGRVAELPRASEISTRAPSPLEVAAPPTAVAVLDPLPARAVRTDVVAKATPKTEHAGGASSADRVERTTNAWAGTPWGAAASVGVAIGNSSRDAAVKTAGFFSRAGKSIGGAF